ncbi:lysylphosphatidylglycerol synthase transmembrane domain-containing protein [Actinomadura alba]|uniref:Flippase-like domain-containing protein n=1 Tax=Actinomadura alba TaxID=406431 RepID=A0ABR7LI51_9ACTN|nr:lysylphosphatidylglycerol synthase transmembrane domain-containing protein [Actinomadura alba]MBC6464098.1 flippase-like domain-containing protein [Actinomadura alba]
MVETVAFGSAGARLPSAAESAPGPVGGARRSRVRTWPVLLALLAAVAGTLVLLRDALPDPGAIWALAAGADPRWLTLVIIAELLSMGAFARLQRRLLRTGGVRISLRRAFAVTYAGNALSTTLPAGTAVSVLYAFRQFRRGGASAPVATAVILLGGVITTSAYTLVGLTALLGEPRARVPTLIALAVAAFLAILPWRSTRVRRALHDLARRRLHTVFAHGRVAPVFHSLRQARDLMRLSRRDWCVVGTLAVLNWAFEILALVAATRALGLELAPHHIMFAYFAAQAAGSLMPMLPGGFGAMEAGLIATLVGFGATAAPAGAAVTVYRLVSLWAVVAVGWLALVALRASDRADRAVRPGPRISLRPALAGVVSRDRALIAVAPQPSR